MGTYLRPSTLSQAVAVLAEASAAGRAPTILAGATDYYPARVGQVADDDILDLSGLPDACGVRAVDGGWWIPALTTWTDLADAPLPPMFDGLRLAARAIGGRQIQNRATVVGNLANASPAADGTPNLLVLDAQVSLASTARERRLPVAQFVTGNRSTTRRPDELVTGIFVPEPPNGAVARSTFLKLGSRAYLVISIAMVAAILVLDGDGRIAGARVAVGACSPVALRLPGLEAALVGLAAAPGIGEVVGPEHLADLAPIDDVRASATYRLEAAETLVRRALEVLVR